MATSRPIGTAAQAVTIGVAAALLAMAARWSSVNPLPLDYAWGSHVETSAAETGMQTVSATEAREIAASFSHIVLDARKAADFAAGHIPGAMSLPVSALDQHFAEVSAMLTPDHPILVYCSGAECEESLELGKILIQSGFTNVTLFAGGIAEWERAGYPVER